jgi:hypothetical protein
MAFTEPNCYKLRAPQPRAKITVLYPDPGFANIFGKVWWNVLGKDMTHLAKGDALTINPVFFLRMVTDLLLKCPSTGGD